MANRSKVDLEWLCRQLAAGRCPKEISHQAGVTSSRIRQIIQEHQLSYNQDGSSLSEARLKEMLEMARKAIDKHDPEKREMNLISRAKRLGLLPLERPGSAYKLKEGWVRGMVGAGFNQVEIAREAGCSVPNVSIFISRHDIEYPGRRTL